jgi:hypothetical protein
VTGFKELDAKLRNLPPKLQRKFVRQSLRKVNKRVQQEFKKIVTDEAFDTGALSRSTKVRALKRSRRRVGVGVYIDREKLFANYAKKHGGKKPHPAAGGTEPFFYPAVVEFGSESHEPVRPMRRALYEHEAEYRNYFRDDVAKLIAESSRP